MAAGVAIGCLAVLLALTFEPVRSRSLRAIVWLWRLQRLRSASNQNRVSGAPSALPIEDNAGSALQGQCICQHVRMRSSGSDWPLQVTLMIAMQRKSR